DHQERDQEERDQHVQRRVREGDLGSADPEDRQEVFNLELMKRTHTRIGPYLAAQRVNSSARSHPHRFEPGGSIVLARTTPAARIPLRSPAATARRRDTNL